jgi:hypothetical protein
MSRSTLLANLTRLLVSANANQVIGVNATGDSVVNSLPGVQGAFKNLQASANGIGATVNVTADEIIVESSAFAYQVLRGVSLSIAGTASGVANGLDTGALNIATWYSVWVIWNGTTTAGLLSLSATAPTMPSGYTHKARVGWIRTDSTANKYPLSFIQAGKNVQYKVAAGSNVALLPSLASGIQGTIGTTLVAISLSSFVPTTASRIRGIIYNGGVTNSTYISPNSVATIPGASGVSCSVNSSGATSISFGYDFILESTNLYYAGNGAASEVRVISWEDNL